MTANQIEEDSGAKQVVYTATTVDESEVSYSLDPTGDYEKFEIDENSGEVMLIETQAMKRSLYSLFVPPILSITARARVTCVIDKLPFVDDSWFLLGQSVNTFSTLEGE